MAAAASVFGGLVACSAHVFAISCALHSKVPDDEKTAAVHFLRLEFTPEAIMALRAGAALAFGIDDARLPARLALADVTREALLRDFG